MNKSFISVVIAGLLSVMTGCGGEPLPPVEQKAFSKLEEGKKEVINKHFAVSFPKLSMDAPTSKKIAVGKELVRLTQNILVEIIPTKDKKLRNYYVKEKAKLYKGNLKAIDIWISQHGYHKNKSYGIHKVIYFKYNSVLNKVEIQYIHSKLSFNSFTAGVSNHTNYDEKLLLINLDKVFDKTFKHRMQSLKIKNLELAQNLLLSIPFKGHDKELLKDTFYDVFKVKKVNLAKDKFYYDFLGTSNSKNVSSYWGEFNKETVVFKYKENIVILNSPYKFYKQKLGLKLEVECFIFGNNETTIDIDKNKLQNLIANALSNASLLNTGISLMELPVILKSSIEKNQPFSLISNFQP
jgi:hypothetical protein